MIGNFSFSLTRNGNLLGEFKNNTPFFTESADRIAGSPEGFIGKYFATWQENHHPRSAILEITKLGTKSLKLTWRENNEITFEGVGEINDESILFGEYSYVGKA